MATTISGNVDARTAAKLRDLATREHRSLSNVVSSAVAVFADLPKDLRDTLLELHSRQDQEGIRRLSREIMAAVARARLAAATDDLAKERLFGNGDPEAGEAGMLAEATRLTRQVAGAT